MAKDVLGVSCWVGIGRVANRMEFTQEKHYVIGDSNTSSKTVIASLQGAAVTRPEKKSDSAIATNALRYIYGLVSCLVNL